jgi:hypothetical protein
LLVTKRHAELIDELLAEIRDSCPNFVHAPQTMREQVEDDARFRHYIGHQG